MCGFPGAIQNPASSIAPVGTILSAASNLVSANTAITSGQRQRQADLYTAGAENQMAGQVQASGQRTAANEQFKAQLLAIERVR